VKDGPRVSSERPSRRDFDAQTVGPADTIRVRGRYGTVQGSPLDRSVLARYAETGAWAERTNTLIQDFFDRDGGTYVDVGGNIGLTTISAAQNPKVQCFVFEPEPENFFHLSENIRANCTHENVVAQQIAVFNRRARLALELSPDNVGDHRLRLANNVGVLGEDEWSTLDVQAAPLDELVDNISEPLAVKIDTQGAEPFVISGGLGTLALAGLVIMEFAPYWMARMGSDPKIVFDLVRDFSTVSLAHGESDAAEPPLPGDEAAIKLQRLDAEYRKTPVGAYWDIIAHR
jgi:FkbM family methyltransferase